MADELKGYGSALERSTTQTERQANNGEVLKGYGSALERSTTITERQANTNDQLKHYGSALERRPTAGEIVYNELLKGYGSSLEFLYSDTLFTVAYQENGNDTFNFKNKYQYGTISGPVVTESDTVSGVLTNNNDTANKQYISKVKSPNGVTSGTVSYKLVTLVDGRRVEYEYNIGNAGVEHVDIDERLKLEILQEGANLMWIRFYGQGFTTARLRVYDTITMTDDYDETGIPMSVNGNTIKRRLLIPITDDKDVIIRVSNATEFIQITFQAQP